VKSTAGAGSGNSWLGAYAMFDRGGATFRTLSSYNYNTVSWFEYLNTHTFMGKSGVTLFVDVGRQVVVTKMGFTARALWETSYSPGRCVLYASNSEEDWASAPGGDWTLLYDQDSYLVYNWMHAASLGMRATLLLNQPYRYYALVVTHLRGNTGYLIVPEWNIEGKTLSEAQVVCECDVHSWRRTPLDICTCDPGYERRDGVCGECAVGTAKPVQGDAGCETCRDSLHAPREGLDRCLRKTCRCGVT